MTHYIFVAVGIAVLVFGGDILVRGAVSLAERLAIPPLVIGLTIVSFGTSAPELFISADAALVGLGGLAVGNVVGSNIANILLVLGLPALFMKTPCAGRAVDRNIMIMIGLTLVFMAMLYFDPLRWHDGIILLILLGLFLREQYVTATSGGTSVLVEAETESDKPANAPDPAWKSTAFLIAGIALLPLGAHLTVLGAQEIASNFGISDAVIGLTVVAIGTSLPELAASLMAVVRGNSSVAVGNVVGSNIFNIAAIMGLTTLITDVSPGPEIIGFDMWVMLAVAIILALVARFLKAISFWTGLGMVCLYVSYVAYSFM